MANPQFRPGEFYQIPNGLHQIVEFPTDLCVLTYLLQCRNGSNTCFPSYQKICQGLFSRRQAIRSVKRLKKADIISTVGTPFKANTFAINMELIIKLTSEANSLVKPIHPTSEITSPPLVKSFHPNHTQLNHTHKPQEDIDNHLLKKKQRGSPAEDPDKYTKGKYGHMVGR
jgi:hypothetical protein